MNIISIVKYVSVFFLVVIGITFLMYPLVMESTSRIEFFLVTISISELVGISIFLFLIRRLGITLADLGFHKPTSITSIILAIFIATIYSLIELQIPQVLQYAFEINFLKCIAITTAIIAGFSEEVVFRGFIITQSRTYGTLKSSLLSASLFGVYHITWGLGGVLGTFLLGLGLAYVFNSSKSIVPCIISHALIDSLIEPGLVISFFHL
ncbi:CPBP family intramembrane glutamic endopeptidase [Sulfurisphaera ohwakuensis]|uniref:CPBP family intramembrane metalloprotease n=1 Tax=Sulfurisphaera ohwakuensis TaxID=69656 RepID=A0A650CHM5_SULOH|nr:CPBP family intramembrane glutamic endopeptidase [Sulfurisphaera ohwakuensis]MBB5255001.1 membrane protease YdiL (CAAX protease family) [Sulfurisphaera ohwakuensis]QGR17279.1 CPBP family intramembrane metalloprotease [Sulfurisphaera ohwakuensis]